jgi:hypothetical protein
MIWLHRATGRLLRSARRGSELERLMVGAPMYQKYNMGTLIDNSRVT